ncbi:MAG: SH3 domain-containing protein [Anaerolineae bacterium]|nr:SH3 domain-containing protein [Anaerolineae bacterium]
MSEVQNSRAKRKYWGYLLLLGGSLALLVGGWLLLQEPPRPAGPLPTAELWTATPTPLPTATLPPTPTSPAEGIGIGSRVRVSGTAGAGLSLRSGPGLDNERVEIAAEGENFTVIGGPVEADGLTWWQLRDEAAPQREGWAAANYLESTGE